MCAVKEKREGSKNGFDRCGKTGATHARTLAKAPGGPLVVRAVGAGLRPRADKDVGICLRVSLWLDRIACQLIIHLFDYYTRTLFFDPQNPPPVKGVTEMVRSASESVTRTLKYS